MLENQTRNKTIVIEDEEEDFREFLNDGDEDSDEVEVLE